MSSLRFWRRVSELWHPTDEELVQLVDGDLSGRARRRVTAHLDSCWACRTRRERIERSISAFMASRAEGHDDEAPQASVRQFQRALAQVAREKTMREKTVHAKTEREPAVSLAWSPFDALRWSARLAVLVGVVWLGVHWLGEQPVSANQLFARMEAAEVDRVRGVLQPVLYQRLRATSSSSSAAAASSGSSSSSAASASAADSTIVWELWRDTERRQTRAIVVPADAVSMRVAPGGGPPPGGTSGGKASVDRAARGPHASPVVGAASAPAPGGGAPSERGASPLLRELDDLFRRNDLDLQQPLSRERFASWRGRERTQDEIRRHRLDDGAPGLTLTAIATRPGGLWSILRAELVVRERDWLPVEQRLTVRHGEGVRVYRIRELESRVVPRATLDASLFAPVVTVPGAAATMAAPVRGSGIRAGTAVTAHRQALRVFERLHGDGAWLSEDVEVSPRVGVGVTVTGTVRTPAQREHLKGLLGGLAVVDVRVGGEAPPGGPALRHA